MTNLKTTLSPEFMSTRNAAAALGVALSTVQLWVETGVLPAWKTAGGHRRIPREAVESMLSEKNAVLPSSVQSGQNNQLKVLVVEDDVVHLELYRQRFAEWALPLQLLTATDGFDGLVQIGRHSPDLVITDLRMPGMDGFRMIRHLREQINEKKFDMGIIVVTALDQTEIGDANSLLPGIPIYSKPIPFIALRALIENKIQRPRLENLQ